MSINNIWDSPERRYNLDNNGARLYLTPERGDFCKRFTHCEHYFDGSFCCYCSAVGPEKQMHDSNPSPHFKWSQPEGLETPTANDDIDDSDDGPEAQDRGD